jgi:carbohydrate-selective porin OprB
MALFAHGLFDARKNDGFGAGFYYYGISDLLKQDIAQLSGGEAATQNEKGSEVFYDFAITPAVRLIPSYQHIWNPLTAEVTRNQRGTDIFLARFAVIW